MKQYQLETGQWCEIESSIGIPDMNAPTINGETVFPQLYQIRFEDGSWENIRVQAFKKVNGEFVSREKQQK